MTRGELRAVLLEWLELERVRYLRLAESLGLPPSTPVSERVASYVTETSMQCTARERHVSTFGAWGTEAGSILHLADRQESSLRPPSVLHDYYGDRCRVWTTTVYGIARTLGVTEGDLPGPKDGPPVWLVALDLLLRSRNAYLSELDSLVTPMTKAAADTVDGLLALMEGDRVWFVTTLAVGGLRVEGDGVEFGDVLVRPLTNEELGRLTAPFDLDALTHPGVPPIARRTFEVTLERCLLLVRTRCPKTQQPQSQRAKSVVLALQLLGFELCGGGEAATYTEPGPSLMNGGQFIKLAERSKVVRSLSTAELRDAVELASLLPEDAFRGAEPKSIALHRFGTAAAENAPADAIIDFVTALEALLVRDRQELSFRLAVRGARYLGVGAADRRTIFHQLRDLYGVRSGLVHGAAGTSDVGKLEAHRDVARDVTGRLLVKALGEGWPTDEQLLDIVLS